MILVDKQPVWNQLIEYYYDEIHWQKQSAGIYEWLEQAYGASSNTGLQTIAFTDDKKAMWFKLQWSS